MNALASPRLTAISCRTILELMCKDKGVEKGSLKAKIDGLAKNGVLAQVVADWAHGIRELGNEGAHDATPVAVDDAREIYDFTCVIGELLYSYPARIQRLRARRQKP